MSTGSRRSKRLKTQSGHKIGDKAKNLNVSSLLGTARGQNVKGLANFPDELLLEILSYFPSFTMPKRSYSPRRADVAIHNARREILHSLALTCRNLRRFFLPYFWEYIESYEGLQFEGRVLERPDHPSQEKAGALELVRQLEMVTVRMPSLAKYVRVIDVTVVKYSELTILPELARCMALFSNLRIIKFVQPQYSNYGRRFGSERAAWKKAFQGTSFPQVQCAILARPFYHALESCPGLRSIQCLDEIEWDNPSCFDLIKSPATLTHFFLPNHSNPDATSYSAIRHIEVPIAWGLEHRLDLTVFKQLIQITVNIGIYSLTESNIHRTISDYFAQFGKLQQEDPQDRFLVLKVMGEEKWLLQTFKVTPARSPSEARKVDWEIFHGATPFSTEQPF